MSRNASPLKSLYRLTVMVGVLTVGSMAAYRYGPPPERLAEAIDAGMERAVEMGEQFGLEGLTAPPAATVAEAPLLAPPAEAAPVWNAAPLVAEPSRRVVGLQERVTVTPLGSRRLAYRATASAPGAGGLVRRYDAVGPTAEEAERAVLAKIEASRSIR